MKRLQPTLILLAIILCSTLNQQSAIASTPLKVDSLYRIGELDNGLRYYIRAHDNPTKHAEFYIIHNVGSLQEEDNQKGLAHFLEHMAFNGTKHFEGKNFLNYFASIGVKFGTNINAYTSKDRTVYNISAVPTERKSVIDSTVLALHDWSSFISCEPHEIEAERGVVREEIRRSDEARMRMMKAVWAFEQQGSKFAERDVLGDVNIINNFTRDELLEYYHKWYRPDLQAVVVVGDIDVDYVEQCIKTTFNKIPRAQNAAARQLYTIDDHQVPNVGFYVDPDSKAISTRISVKIPYISAEDAQTHKYLEHEMMYGVLINLLRERYGALANSDEPSLKAAITSTTEVSYYGRTITITALPINENVKMAAYALIAEYERISRYGFSQQELTKAIKSYQMTLQQRNSKVKVSRDYVEAAVENYTRATPLIDDVEYITLSNSIVQNLSLEQINDFSKQVLTDKNRTIVFCRGAIHNDNFPSEQEVLQQVADVKKQEMECFELAEVKGANFREIDNFATICSRTYDQDIQADRLMLSNGMQIIWRQTNQGRNPIEVNYMTLIGRADNSIENISPVKLVDHLSSYFCLSQMSKQSKDAWFDQQGITMFSRISRNASRMTIHSKSADKMSTIFKLIDGYATGVSIDPKDYARFKSDNLKELAKPKSESNIYKDSLLRVKYKSTLPSSEVTQEDLKTKAAEVCLAYNYHFGNMNNSYLIVSTSIDLDDAIDIINSSFEQLPLSPRPAKPTVEIPSFDQNEGVIELHYKPKDSKGTKSKVNVSYRIESQYNSREQLNVDIFSHLFRDRLMNEIREQMGATYSISLKGSLIHDDKSSQVIEIEFDTDPKLLDAVNESIDKILVELSQNGPSESELDNIKLYLSKRDEKSKQNGLSFTTDQVRIISSGVDIKQNRSEILKQLTATDITNVAKRYHTEAKVVKASYTN